MGQPHRFKPEREPLYKRFGALLWRERRTCLWSAIVGTLLGIVAVIWFRHKLLTLAIALLAGLSRGCQTMLDDLKELR